MTLTLGAICSVVALAAYVAKLAYDYGRLKTRYDNTERKVDDMERDFPSRIEGIRKYVNESNDRTADKIENLSKSHNDMQTVLVELTTTLRMFKESIGSQLDNLEKKVDALAIKIDAK